MRTFLTVCILYLASHNLVAQGYIMSAEVPFTLLDIQGNIHLELVASDKTQLEFAKDTVPEELNIEWSDGVLSLKTNTELKKTPAIQVKLHLEHLTDLEITRGAVVQSADVLKTKVLSIKADTGGKAEFSIEADSVYAKINQGSDVILSGSTRSQSIHAITMGNYLAYELEAEKTWVKANTGAQVKVNTSYYLNANSKSGALVAYMGNPNHTAFKNSTGGKITPQDQ